MSRRRPSRPVLPSRVPGAKWVQVSPLDEPIYWALDTGTEWVAIVQWGWPGWAAVPVGSTRLVASISTWFSTKLEAMRWAERQVLT